MSCGCGLGKAPAPKMSLQEVRALVKAGKARCEIENFRTRVCMLRSNGKEIYRRKLSAAQIRKAASRCSKGGCKR